jgi:hypothetical protein
LQELTTRTFNVGVTRKRLFPFVNENLVSQQNLSKKWIEWRENQREDVLPFLLEFFQQQNRSPNSNPLSTIKTGWEILNSVEKKNPGKIQSVYCQGGIGFVLMRLESVDHQNIYGNIFNVTEQGATDAKAKISLMKPLWWDKYLEQKVEREIQVDKINEV